MGRSPFYPKVSAAVVFVERGKDGSLYRQSAATIVGLPGDSVAAHLAIFDHAKKAVRWVDNVPLHRNQETGHYYEPAPGL